MTTKCRILLVGAISILTTTASVWAQPAATEMDFGSADALSKARLVVAFVKADVNKDGKLSRLEAEDVPGLVAMFETFDADGDDFVSRAEFNRGIQ